MRVTLDVSSACLKVVDEPPSPSITHWNVSLVSSVCFHVSTGLLFLCCTYQQQQHFSYHKEKVMVFHKVSIIGQ